MKQMKRPSWRRYSRLAILFSLFQKDSAPEEATDTAALLDDEEPGVSRIRCPLCRWQPNADDLWLCGDCEHPEYFFDGCGAEWHTFTTQGLCPGCGYQWRWTACLNCEGWSLHEDWYAREAE
jgi:hypothetical protein